MQQLKLEKILPHQQKALTALTTVFDAVQFTAPKTGFDNPQISISDSALKSALDKARTNVFSEWQNFASANESNHCLYLDVKMETGTGKTYVYTNLMYELFERYRLSKFIILVPSLAVKAGTKQFITDAYTKYHFTQECDYRGVLDSYILEAKAKKKGRQYFPSAVTEFTCANTRGTSHISVLLANMQLLTTSDMMRRSDYGCEINGFYRPFDALKSVHPVVIIDEPHRFNCNQQAWQTLMEEIEPECVIRFGATFPEHKEGRGNTAKTVKDYKNLVYNLDACESFNSGLVKEITKEHFEASSKTPEKVKLISVVGKSEARFQITREEVKQNKSTETKKTFVLKKDDSLSRISSAFSDLTIDGVGKNFISLSNGMQKMVGESFTVDTFLSSYQEGMIALALRRHFETERINFNRTIKIKTLALFFIDDIPSYRGKTNDGEETEPYLKEMFERLLKASIKKLLKELKPEESEYAAYLTATLDDISASHAGYFSQDNADSDETIAAEVQDILVNKKQLLSIRNEDGTYNTRRFLFSKWTLKEGWDNPNVFTIAKLRSSGSDNSKIQEVGRGLRLPVDENGNRISDEPFMLNYIVDFTEEDFAEKLIAEINGDRPAANYISVSDIQECATKRNVEYKTLFISLLTGNFIDPTPVHLSDDTEAYAVVTENADSLIVTYPEFNKSNTTMLQHGKVLDANKKQKDEIHIRKGQYNELKNLWLAINKKYALVFSKELDDRMDQELPKILSDEVFSNSVMTSRRDVVQYKDGSMMISTADGVQEFISHPILYGEFLNRASERTQIPAYKINEAIHCYSNKLQKAGKNTLNNDDFNEQSLERLVAKVTDWKIKNFEGRYQYLKVSGENTKQTVLNYANGLPKDTISIGRIGTIIEQGKPSADYLYDIIAYDSPLEGADIKSNDVNSVVVYGKIPRKSIAIPTVTGETYSPDFMYVVKKADGKSELNLIVETKDVKAESELRGVETEKIKCAEVFFKNLQEEGIPVVFKKQLSSTAMKTIIQNALIT